MKLSLNKTILPFFMILSFQFGFSQQKTKTLYEKKVHSITINFLNELGLNSLATKYNNTGNLGQLMALSEMSTRLNTKKGTIAFLRFNEELKNAEKLKNANELKKDKLKKDGEVAREKAIENERLKIEELKRLENSDYVKITKSIKTEFSKWLQKDEFEKIETYNNRIKNNIQFSFDSICSSTINKAIEIKKESKIAQLFIDEYDSEKEVFKINIKVFNETVKDTLQVKINDAKEFKSSSENGKYLIFPKDLNEWGIIGNDLYPLRLFINDYDFKRVLKLKYNEIKELNFSTSDLGISHNDIENIKFNYENYKKVVIIKENEIKIKDSIRSANRVYSSAGIEVQPSYSGGWANLQKYFNDQIKSLSLIFSEDQRVFFKLIVEKDGSVSDVKITKGISPEIDEKLIKIMSDSNKWQSGWTNGRQVRTSYLFPISISKNTEF